MVAISIGEIDMIRVLQVYPQMNNAGTERVIFNLYENIDTSRVQFDFLAEVPGELDEKIKQMGGNIFYIKEVSQLDYYRKLISFFKSHPEYQIIHTHTHARMWIVLKAAKKCGVKCRIAHSHNARNDLPQAAAIIKGLMSIPIEQNANYFFACSSNAARWLFPHRKDCKILYNGIDLNDYLYTEEKRHSKRMELSIQKDEFVMIHIGRFAKQKNHEYLIKILAEYNLTRSNWKMLLVGVGPLQDYIKYQAKAAGIYDNIIFLDNRTDVNELLSAADLFVFPSLHEGLGIVVIEAQASGLHCIVSDAVPKEADLGIGLISTLSLDDPIESWVSEINKHSNLISKRSNYINSILNSKYNIKKIGEMVEKFYMREEL